MPIVESKTYQAEIAHSGMLYPSMDELTARNLKVKQSKQLLISLTVKQLDQQSKRF